MTEPRRDRRVRRRSRVLAVQAIRRSPDQRRRDRSRRNREDRYNALRAEVFAPGRVPDQAVLDAFESYRARVRSAAGLDPEGA